MKLPLVAYATATMALQGLISHTISCIMFTIYVGDEILRNTQASAQQMIMLGTGFHIVIITGPNTGTYSEVYFRMGHA